MRQSANVAFDHVLLNPELRVVARLNVFPPKLDVGSQLLSLRMEPHGNVTQLHVFKLCAEKKAWLTLLPSPWLSEFLEA